MTDSKKLLLRDRSISWKASSNRDLSAVNEACRYYGRRIVQNRVKKKPRKQKLTNAERIKSYSELQIGDYVVHINHGIGKYLGIETLEINGIHKDYLNIHYQGSDKLYVPVEQIDQVQKYVGSEGKSRSCIN